MLIPLITRKTSCAVINNFLPNDYVERLRATMSGLPFSEYEHVRGLYKFGQALAESRSRELFLAYMKWGATFEDRIRTQCGHFPFREVHNWLIENWPSGIEFCKLGGHNFPSGIVRLHKSDWLGERVHIDEPPKPVADSTNQPLTQIGILLFLETPSIGGELHIWANHSYTRKTFETAPRDPEALGPPTHKISVRPGQLIAFRTDHPHTVTSVMKGRRLSMGLFAVGNELSKPLKIWA